MKTADSVSVLGTPRGEYAGAQPKGSEFGILENLFIF
jgi:hypothetical protein